MSRFKDLLLNVVLIMLGFSIAFLLIEVSAFLGFIPENWFQGHKYCDGTGDRGMFHPIYGRIERSNAQYLEKLNSEDDWSLVTYNSQGFRDTYNSGNKTIIILGDSLTKGTLADDNSTYPYLLDRWAPKTVFKNYGQPGYNTGQELLLYRDVSKKVNHSLVILGYTLGNDAKENLGSMPRKPKFNLTDKGPVLVQKPRRRKGFGIGIIQHPILQRIRGYLSTHTASYNLIAPRLKRLLVKNIWRWEREEIPTKQKKVEKELKMTKALVKEIGREAKKNGGDLLIVSFPVRGEINPKNPDYYSQKQKNTYYKAQRKMLKNITRSENQIKYLDLKPFLKEEIEKGKRVFGRINAHLDDYGYRVTAKAIYNKLVKEGYIKNNTEANFTKDYTKEITACP